MATPVPDRMDTADLAQTILRASADGVLVVDENGVVVHCNQAAGELFGRDPAGLVGEHFGTTAEGREGASGRDLQLLRRDGSVRIVEPRTSSTTWNGIPVRILTLRDVTSDRATARRLQALKAALEAAHNAVQITDEDGRVTWVNPAFTEMTGYAPGEVLGRDLEAVARILGQNEVFETEVRPRLEEGRPWQGRLTGRRKDGGPFEEERTITPVPDPSGEGRSLISVGADITGRSAAERHRRRLLAILEASPNLVGVSDPDGTALYMNRAGREMLGLDPDASVEGRSISSFYPPDIARLVREEAMPAAVREGSWSGEARLVTDSGRTIPVWQVIVAHESEDPTREGGVGFFSTIMGDLSQWKETQEALRERVKELRTLYAASRELARFDVPLERRLAQVVVRLPPGWLHPEITEARIHWDDAEVRTPGFRETEWALSAPVVTRGRTEGEVRVCLLEERPPRDEGPFLAEERELIDAIAAAIGEAIDREHLQAQFAQSQKLETIGRLAGGAAHDFNNLLAVIQGNSQLILDALPAGAELRDDVDQILKATRRGASLTSQLLAFSRRQVLEEEVVDLRNVVVDIEPMLRRLVPERIALPMEPGGEPRYVKVDPAQLDQALMNLVVNAVDAVEDEGRIGVSVDELRLSADEAAGLPWEAAPGDYARLVVEDTGTGIRPEDLSRVFEPFFTTKKEGRGTGLGLSMVYGFVKQSGGHVFVDSTPGEGTRVELLFPLAPLPRATPPAQGSADGAGADRQLRSSPQPARVLLVEDDEGVRRLARKILAAAGCEVVVAKDGREALRLAREAPVDVALTDVVMPSMGGAELAEALRGEHPDLPVVFMSGYSEEEITRRLHLRGSAFLRKPFSREDLERAVRDALPG